MRIDRICLMGIVVICSTRLIYAASAAAEPVLQCKGSFDSSRCSIGTDAAASQPAERKGLSVIIKPAKARFGPAEPLSFSVTLGNDSDKDFTLLHDPWSSDGWKLTLGVDKPNESYQVIRTRARVEEETQGKPLVLKSHEEHSFQWTFGENFGYLLNGRPGPKIHLPAGTYRLTVSKTMEPAANNAQIATLPPLWVGKVVCTSAPFEVAGK